MSTSRKSKPPLDFSITPASRGKRTDQVEVMLADKLIVNDCVNLKIASKRQKLAKEIFAKTKTERADLTAEVIEEQLLQVLKNAKESETRGSESDPVEVLQTVKLVVYAVDSQGRVYGYSEHTGKQFAKLRPAAMKPEDALQIVGDVETFHRYNTPADEGSVTLTQLKAAIALVASTARSYESLEQRGQGIYEEGIASRECNAIIDGGEVYLQSSDGTLELAQGFVFGDTIVNRDSSKQWHGSLGASVRTMSAKKSNLVRKSIRDIFAKWHWKHPSDAALCMALCACTVVQRLLHWRPNVSLIGPPREWQINPAKASFGAVTRPPNNPHRQVHPCLDQAGNCRWVATAVDRRIRRLQGTGGTIGADPHRESRWHGNAGEC